MNQDSNLAFSFLLLFLCCLQYSTIVMATNVMTETR